MNKILKHKKLLIISIALGIIAGIFYKNQDRIYISLGTRLFGGEILGHKMYNIDLAEDIFNLADHGDHAPMWANYQLSRIAFIKGDLGRSIEYADKELLLHPDNCRTYYIRGLSHGYMEQLDSAISDFEKFNSICVQDSWAGHNDLAWFYFRKGDMNKVIETIEKVKHRYLYNPWIQNTYGTALLNTGRYDEALSAFNRAKESADRLTAADWGRAYPGNDPRIYDTGLTKMRETIDANIKICQDKLWTISTETK